MIQCSSERGVAAFPLWPAAIVGCVSLWLFSCARVDAARDEDHWRVGEPCLTSDEAVADFGGYSELEINIEDGGSCGPVDVCLVHDFRGRASCPSGQVEAAGGCTTPSGDAVVVPVAPQLPTRPADLAMVCSCRCDGPDPNVNYCACPDGMSCRELRAAAPGSVDDFAGSYCVY